MVTIGQTNFRLELPSNIETRTTTLNGVSTVITVTADYQCGVSLGARRVFHVQLQNGNEMKLDYCLVLNNAVQIMQRSNNMSMMWSFWQISLNTSPTVAIHMTGIGEDVHQIELWVSAYLTSNSESVSISPHTSTGYPTSYDTVCRAEGYTPTSTNESLLMTTSSCTTFARSSGTASSWPYVLLGNEGTLNLSGIGNYYYFRMNSSTQGSFQSHNVGFKLVSNLSSTVNGNNIECFPSSLSSGYALTFPDGSSEEISSCITTQQGTWELHLSTHSPHAGLLILSDGMIYYLVSM
jgi:hypothetical protein